MSFDTNNIFETDNRLTMTGDQTDQDDMNKTGNI